MQLKRSGHTCKYDGLKGIPNTTTEYYRLYSFQAVFNEASRGELHGGAVEAGDGELGGELGDLLAEQGEVGRGRGVREVLEVLKLACTCACVRYVRSWVCASRARV